MHTYLLFVFCYSWKVWIYWRVSIKLASLYEMSLASTPGTPHFCMAHRNPCFKEVSLC